MKMYEGIIKIKINERMKKFIPQNLNIEEFFFTDYYIKIVVPICYSF